MPETPATPPVPATAPQNLESLALQSAPAIGKSIISQSGVWGLMFVLLVGVQMFGAWYAGTKIIPDHIDKINAGHKESWAACKAAIEAERVENRANLEAQRQNDSRNTDRVSAAMESLGQRIDRGFDRIRDRGAVGKKDVGIGSTTTATRDGG